jgi:hypothetical protein
MKERQKQIVTPTGAGRVIYSFEPPADRGGLELDWTVLGIGGQPMHQTSAGDRNCSRVKRKGSRGLDFAAEARLLLRG